MSGRAWAAFAAVSILWGIPYLFIKIAVDDGVSPAFLAWVRVVLGGGGAAGAELAAGPAQLARAAGGGGWRYSPWSRS